MKTVAILAELNPLHNGHMALISHAREKLEAGAVIVLLSGDFVQRGEPAVINKMRRARAALSAGADLVLELPVIYALAPAEIFARGAIMTLAATGVVDELLFGSESGNLAALSKTAEVLNSFEDDPGFIAQLLGAMRSGDSYPKALAHAVNEKQAILDTETDPGADILQMKKQSPNDLLGVEYIRSIHALGSPIRPLCMKREPASDHVNSASALRSILASSDRLPGEIRSFVPEPAFQELSEVDSSDREHFVFPNDLSSCLKYRLLLMDPEELAGIADVGRDLAGRIHASRLLCDSFDSYAGYLKVKAFTLARIRRALLQLILGITREERKKMLSERTTLLRVLGFRESARHLLSAIAAMKSAPLIVRGADYHKDYTPLEKRLIELTVFSGNLYDVFSLDSSLRSTEEEKMPVIIT